MCILNDDVVHKIISYIDDIKYVEIMYDIFGYDNVYYEYLRRNEKIPTKFKLIEENVNFDNIFFDKIKNFKYLDKMIIAGGYPFRLYNNLDTSNCDIDIFFYGTYMHDEEITKDDRIDHYLKTYSCSDLVEKNDYYIQFLYFIEKHFTIKKVESTSSMAIINIYIEEIENPLQIIITSVLSPFEIIHNFDSSHVKCCIYNNKFLVTQDCQFTQKYKVVYTDGIITRKRYNKIKEHKLEIINEENISIIETITPTFQITDMYKIHRHGVCIFYKGSVKDMCRNNFISNCDILDCYRINIFNEKVVFQIKKEDYIYNVIPTISYDPSNYEYMEAVKNKISSLLQNYSNNEVSKYTLKIKDSWHRDNKHIINRTQLALRHDLAFTGEFLSKRFYEDRIKLFPAERMAYITKIDGNYTYNNTIYSKPSKLTIDITACENDPFCCLIFYSMVNGK